MTEKSFLPAFFSFQDSQVLGSQYQQKPNKGHVLDLLHDNKYYVQNKE
jgi:hypothetical protein